MTRRTSSNMTKIILLSLFLVVIPGQGLYSQTEPEIRAKFLRRHHVYKRAVMPYRLFSPESYDHTKKYPLVLALHGAGERGHDNESHIKAHRLATAWADTINQRRPPCFVAAPQCPPNQRWVDNDWARGFYGSWDIITRFPWRFAAAVPMSGGRDSTKTNLIAPIPLWIFHGEADNVVPASGSRQMVTALENHGKTCIFTHHNFRTRTNEILPDSILAKYLNAGARLIYTEYKGAGHIMWEQSYNNRLMVDWVFAQSKSAPTGVKNLESSINSAILNCIRIIQIRLIRQQLAVFAFPRRIA